MSEEREFLYCEFCNPPGGPVRSDAVASFLPSVVKLPLTGAMFDAVHWDRERCGPFAANADWEALRCPCGKHRVMMHEGKMRVRGGFFVVSIGLLRDEVADQAMAAMTEEDKEEYVKQARIEAELRKKRMQAEKARSRADYVTKRGVK